MQKLSNVSNKYNHTQEQAELLNASLADESILLQNLKTVDPEL